VIIFCGVIFASGYLLMSLIQNTWQYYSIYGLLIGAGVGGFWAPLVSTVARWFTGRRGLMTGIVSGGISFGTLLLPPVVTQLITTYDWRITYVIIGGVILVAVMIAAQFLRTSPQMMGVLPYGEKEAKSKYSAKKSVDFSFGEAIRTRQFWMVGAIYLCFGFIQLTVMVHVVPHATGLGNSAINSAIVLSIIGGTSLAGRIVMGIVADKVKAKITIVLCLILLTVALTWLQVADNLWGLYLFAVLFGFGYGGLSCLQSVMSAELFGLTALGLITAIFSFSFNIGGAVGPVLAGHIFDVSQSYRWAFAGCLAIAAVALVISVSVKPPKRK
jgi:MFS family permease